MSSLPALKVEFVSQAAPAYKLRGQRVVAGRGPKREVRPLDICADVYARFAALDDTPEAFAEFMAAFGPLTHNGHQGGERLDHLVAMRKQMAGIVNEVAANPGNLTRLPNWRTPAAVRALARSATGWSRAKVDKDGNVVGRAKRGTGLPSRSATALSDTADILSAAVMMAAIVRPGAPDGRPTLYMQPDTLWDAMKLQLYIAVSCGGRLRACDWCGKWFEAGGPGKRADAKFCSPGCRLHAHRHKNGGSK